MITISKHHISEWLLLDAYSEIHIAKDKIRFFERKYNTNFAEFEKNLNREKENIEHFDDYIEWKAYMQVLQSAQKKVNDIRHGYIKIS